MELLLNLFWFALAVGAFWTLVRTKRIPARKHRISGAEDIKSLLALSCVLVLLFPVVSASDDLHPTQALLEDATKRIQQGITSLNIPVGHRSVALVPVVFAASAWFGLSLLGVFQSAAMPARVRYRGQRLDNGRSPPAV